MNTWGSSPRVRGAARTWRQARPTTRIIPARAGSRSVSTWRRGLGQDHPRACGEQRLSSQMHVWLRGSSPRVRGAGRVKQCANGYPRIIPARAGSSPGRARTRQPCTDHPRACGEQRQRRGPRQPQSGSSPRVRGAGLRHLLSDGHRGIIPARAGSRGGLLLLDAVEEDHPRACGEQRAKLRHKVDKGGSSPRVRGAVFPLIGSTTAARIIPARAGSSIWSGRPLTHHTDHPRACGEQFGFPVGGIKKSGSSPRVRGAADTTRQNLPALRIIPARAGSRIPVIVGTNHLKDHPRACGEQVTFLAGINTLMGSSPRVRGAAHSYKTAASRSRIIPARAGSRTRHLVPGRPQPDHPRACGEQN